MEILKLENISKYYNKGKSNECCALKDVSLSVEKGEFAAIIGKSGSGKSTLLHIAGLTDSYSAGSLFFNGECVDKMRQSKTAGLRVDKTGFILQDFGLIWDMSVHDNIAVPLYIKGVGKKEREKVIKEAAEEMGVLELLKKKTRELSGGQCQRVAIARAVANRPEIIFADEPTGALDHENAVKTVELLKSINKHGTTILMVTHDMEMAAQADRVIKIADGRIVEK